MGEAWQERTGLRVLSGRRLPYPWNGLRCGGWSRAQTFVEVVAEEGPGGGW